MANKYKQIRLNEGLSVKELVRLIGVNKSTIWRWENGLHKPNEKNLQKLMGISLHRPSNGNLGGLIRKAVSYIRNKFKGG